MASAQSQSSESQKYMEIALSQARLSPPKPTNFCVGACIVAPEDGERPLLVTGYTLEEPGNTHAEQSCFIKLAREYGCDEAEIGPHLPEPCALYTTMEPCGKRSLGNLPCVDRILRLRRRDGRPAIGTVYVGVSEPETFVGVNQGRLRLSEAGIEIVQVPGFEDEILRVATAGHAQEESR